MIINSPSDALTTRLQDEYRRHRVLYRFVPISPIRILDKKFFFCKVVENYLLKLKSCLEHCLCCLRCDHEEVHALSEVGT
jgi:hypothetical protein